MSFFFFRVYDLLSSTKIEITSKIVKPAALTL